MSERNDEPPKTAPPIEALPGRVVLRYGAPVEQKPDSLIIIPSSSQRRPELGRLVHIGKATTPIEEIQREAIIDADQSGRVFPIEMVRGEPMWTLEMGDEYAWLKEYRAFAIGQLFATMADPEKAADSAPPAQREDSGTLWIPTKENPT